MELARLPRSWIQTTGNLVFWEQHEKVNLVLQSNLTFFDIISLQGGHFAALERPDDLKSDLIKFVDQVWPDIAGTK
jgi:microsomal epoxide hydrolase